MWHQSGMWLGLLVAASAALAQPAAQAGDQRSDGRKIDGCPGVMVFFDTDSAALSPQAEQTLSNAFEWMRPMIEAGAWLEISGQADDRGPAAYNLVLSRRRAESVRDWYLRRGVPADRLQVIARGEENPLALPRAGEPLEHTRRQNRNVHAGPVMTIEVFHLFFPPGGPIC